MFVRALLLCLAFASSSLAAENLDPEPPAKPAAVPVGYQKKVTTAINPRWAAGMKTLGSTFSVGLLEVRLSLDAEGKVTAFKVIENTSNKALAEYSEKIVRETVFEKPPEKALVRGVIEIPLNFRLY